MGLISGDQHVVSLRDRDCEVTALYRKHASIARQFAHLHDQHVGRRAVLVAARVLFVADNLSPNESLDLRRHVERFMADSHSCQIQSDPDCSMRPFHGQRPK